MTKLINPLAALQQPRGTVWHLLHNYTPEYSFNEEIKLSANARESSDFPIAERLINVFHEMTSYERRAIIPEDRPNSGIWEMSKHEFHGELYQALYSSDLDRVADCLRNCLRTKLTHGLGLGEQVYDAMSVPGEGQVANALIIRDRLISLAVATGALPEETSEQGRYGINASLPLGELVKIIEQRLEVEIYRPQVMGIFGPALGECIYDARVPDDAYTSFRLKTLCDSFHINQVAEIGGGFGGNAFQSIRSGIKSFSIFDLPLVCIIQGWFLMKIFGGDQIAMFSEGVDERPINIMPYWEFYNPQREFGIVVNRDSMPEIPEQLVDQYLREIERRGAIFLSINQESLGESGVKDITQLWVSRMMDARVKMRRTTRHRHWTRAGYVEELYMKR